MLLNRSVSVAFCGIAAALSTVLMFFTGLVPIATYALPALAGLVCMVVVVELGIRWAWSVYGTVSVLSVLLAADKEAVVLFVLFFGYYPILKAMLERKNRPVFSWIIKFLVFNAAMVGGFFIAITLLGVPEESFLIFGNLAPFLVLLLGNGVFFVYDYTISGLVVSYYQRFHKLVQGWLRKK